MSWRVLLGKRTWLGAAVAAVTMAALLGVGSLLLLRGVLPEGAMGAVVYVGAAAAVFCGGRFAAKRGGGALPRSLAVSALVYGGMWLASLGGEAQVAFGGHGVLLTAAVWGGGLTAGLITRPWQGRRRISRTGRRGARGRGRAVT